MAKLRGVVLAAGRGVRMGGTKPKTLVEVPDGKPMIDYVLEGLKAAGVEDLLVVTGFAAKQVEEHVTSVWGADNLTFVFNARHASWQNFHSLRVALDQSPAFDVLVSNSDVIVAPDAYSAVAGSEGDLVLAVQRRPQHQLNDEDMRVELSGHKILTIGKSVKLARSHGEFAGISLVRRPAALLYDRVASALEWRGETRLYYEDVYGTMLDRVDARAVDVGPNDYAEVDTPDDLDAAAEVVRRWSEARATQPA